MKQFKIVWRSGKDPIIIEGTDKATAMKMMGIKEAEVDYCEELQ